MALASYRRLSGNKGRLLAALGLLLLGLALSGCVAGEPGQSLDAPSITVSLPNGDEPQAVSSTLQIFLLLMVLSLAPAILIMMTSFTRIIIVLALLRQSLGLAQTPPNQVLIGLALFLSLFIMSPVLGEINTVAYEPFTKGQITQEQAVERGLAPLRTFMLKQTREKDIGLFLSMGNIEQPDTPDDVPTHVLVPAFVLSELKTAFQMGFVIFIPCLVIDMAVASVLMSMGMMMLPPMMISLPFKLLLFVLVDGWYLVVQSLVVSFG